MSIYCPLCEALGIEYVPSEDSSYNPSTKEFDPSYMGNRGIFNAFYGKKHTEETKQIIREKRSKQTVWNKGIKTGPQSKEQVEHRARLISKIQTGKKHTRQRIDNMRTAISKNWMIVFPDGRTEKIRNLNQFCKDNDLSQSSMWKVSVGKAKHHKGFTVKEIYNEG